MHRSIKDASRYKLIVSDFDGTLAGADHMVGQKVAGAVKRWIASGRQFTIATGRQYLMIDDECKKLSLKTPVIVRGGSEIVDPVNERVLHSEWMEKDDVEVIYNKVKKSNLFNYGVEVDDEIFMDFKLDVFFPRIKLRKTEEFKVRSVPKFHLKPKSKDLVKEAEEFINDMVRQLPKVHSIATHNKQFGIGWDITSVKATKLHGIVKVMEMLNISREEIVGVGDSYNDFPLLEAAGLKVAMGNAHQELKEIADVVVSSNEEDGVAYLIDQLLK